MRSDKIFLTKSLSMNEPPHGALVGIRGEWLGAIIPILDGEEIVIGRDPKCCSLILPEKTVSRRHCSIVYHEVGGNYSVWDWSLNGTYTDKGERLEKGREYFMKTGDELRIGDGANILKLG